jgi:hypothetical protein
MIINMTIKGFEKQKVEVNTGGVIFMPTLLIDGQQVMESFWGRKFTLAKDDGTQVTGKWKARLYGFDIPSLEIENQVYQVVPPNSWFECIWSAMPAICLAFFSKDPLWGVLFGLVASSINLHLFHYDWRPWIKYLTAGAISLAAIGLFLLLEPIILAPISFK